MLNLNIYKHLQYNIYIKIRHLYVKSKYQFGTNDNSRT